MSPARWGVIVVCIGAVIAGCAPTRVLPRNEDELVKIEEIRSRPVERKTTAEVEQATDGARIVVSARQTCNEYRRQVLHRKTIVEKHASVAALVVFYSLAATGVGVGSWVLADAPNIPLQNDPNTTNPVGRPGAYAIGGITVGLGVAALALGIGTNVRARDSVTDGGDMFVPVPASAHQVECGTVPVAQQRLLLFDDDSGTKVALGTTRADGSVQVSWRTTEPLFHVTKPPVTGRLRLESGNDVVGEVDLKPARQFVARSLVTAAEAFVEHDAVDEATAHADRAAALGADVTELRAMIAASPTTVRRKREAEKKEHENAEQAERLHQQWLKKWGPFAEWAARRENSAVVRSLQALAARQHAVGVAQAAYEKEKERNDANVVEARVWSVPLYPETSGNFQYIKALDHAAGEALFEATDGLFVLHLSVGDSFTAAPGDMVRMTMHSRGQTMTMTNGRVLPVFWSGASPGRMRSTPGHRPNRTREHSLQQRATAAAAVFRRTLNELTSNGAEGGRRVLTHAPAGTQITVETAADDENVSRILIADGDGKSVYCLSADTCAGAGETVPLSTLARVSSSR